MLTNGPDWYEAMATFSYAAVVFTAIYVALNIPLTVLP